MLLSEGIGEVLPDVLTLEEGVKVYRQFYSQEDEDDLGVIGFKLDVVNVEVVD